MVILNANVFSASDTIYFINYFDFYKYPAESPKTADLGERPAFYLPENESRYEAYFQRNDISYENAVRLVNAGADLDHYSEVAEIADPADTLVFCAKNRKLPDGYEPDDLREVYSTGVMLRNDAACALERMIDAMYSEGHDVVLISGYRSYDSQKWLFDSRSAGASVNAADMDTARAGHSEHQTGLAVDLLHRVIRPLGNAGFQRTAQYAWLTANAHEYGFILRYPENYTDVTGFIYEPWHWRYVGADAATEMKEGGYGVFELYWGEINFVPDIIEINVNSGSAPNNGSR